MLGIRTGRKPDDGSITALIDSESRRLPRVLTKCQSMPSALDKSAANSSDWVCGLHFDNRLNICHLNCFTCHHRERHTRLFWQLNASF
jgi:hypothetical protein